VLIKDRKTIHISLVVIYVSKFLLRS